MKENNEVPEPVWLKPIRKDKYGKPEGWCDDEPTADPDELERQVFQEEFEAVLALPRPKYSEFRPSVDEYGVDWSAFASVDFDRYRGQFDKARYKVDRLREEVKDQVIMFDIIKDRLPGKAKYKVLKYIKLGILDIDDIVNMDMWSLARVYVRIRRLQREIANLQETSEARRVRRLKAWLES